MTSSTSDTQEPIARGEPLREAVYDRIVELICSGRYPPGSPLTEATLSRSLQVSRTPVREALLRLQAEGVLESALARGFTVRRLVRSDVVELYPIIATLERLAICSVEPVQAGMLDTLRATAQELEKCADPVRRWRLDTKYHAAIVDAAGNQHLLGMITQLRTNLSRYELAYMREVRSRVDADRQHQEILAALAAGELDHAGELVESHWQDGMRRILEWLDRQPAG